VASAADSIGEAAVQQRSDLLVIGANGLASRRSRSGSTTGLVLTNAPCPVLVVRSELPDSGAP